MGLFSGLHEKVFGGNNNSAQKEQLRSNRESREFTTGNMDRALTDIDSYYNRGDQARNDSYNMALALLGGSIMPQIDMVQGGNMAAQAAILGGTPQIYQGVRPDPSQFNVQLPSYSMPQSAPPVQMDYAAMVRQALGGFR